MAAAPSRHLSRPGRDQVATGAIGTTQTIVHVLNRIAFGPRPGDVERVQALGLQRYIDEQLHPERIRGRRRWRPGSRT